MVSLSFRDVLSTKRKLGDDRANDFILEMKSAKHPDGKFPSKTLISN